VGNGDSVSISSNADNVTIQNGIIRNMSRRGMAACNISFPVLCAEDQSGAEENKGARDLFAHQSTPMPGATPVA
jgi:hypothetical protein